jgi:hypothetical protein
VHRTEPAHCSVRPSSISKPAQGHVGINWPNPPGRWLCTRAPGHRFDRAPTPIASAASRPRQLPPDLHAPRMQPPPTCAAPLAGARTLALRARDSCAAAAATSRRRCRPVATSAACTTHAAVAPCVTSSHCRSRGEAVSPLPATAVERAPTPLCSRRPPLLPHHRTPLLQAPKR